MGQRMQHYVIKDYQAGFEQEQARIALEAARDWIWPYAYRAEDLLKFHAQPDFDPETLHFCFLGDEMVGYVSWQAMPAGDRAVPTATLDFPRMVPGHERAAVLLIERAFETLRRKGVSRVVGRVTTMCPADIELAESTGFAISDWGYKVYYSYEMGRGRLRVPDDRAVEIDPGNDLDACAELAARWYGRSSGWCRSHLAEWHAAGIIAHVCVREQGEVIAACMAAPNDIRPSTAANYYIYSPDECSLRPMLAKVVSKCVDGGVHNLIADLIHEHRQYEPVYQQLGFRKVAEWARCERELR